MINLIDIEDFPEGILIPSNAVEPNERLDGIIEMFQPEIIKGILGEIEYINFENDFTTVEPIVPQSTKWLEFLNGKEYDLTTENQTITVKYLGLKPILTKFIYYYYQRDIVNSPGADAQIILDLKNAVQVVPIDKMINIWNLALDLTGLDWNGLFPYYKNRKQKITDNEKYKATAYNYLFYNTTDFPDWCFTYQGRITLF